MTENNTITFTDEQGNEGQYIRPQGTLHYLVEEGGEDFAPQMAPLGESVKIYENIPERAFYVFAGWRDENGNTYAPGDYFTITGDHLLIAQWDYEYSNGGSLTFNLVDGTGDFPPVFLPAGSDYQLSGVPERVGYKFVKWRNKNGEEFAFDDVYCFIYGDDTLTAVWEKLCVITYNGYGEDESVLTIYAEKGETICILLYENQVYGAAFQYWVDDDYNIYQPGAICTVNGDLTLNPFFLILPEETVHYETNGGTGIFPDQTAPIGEEVTIYGHTPIYDFYDFLYWTDDYGTIYRPGQSFSVSTSMTLTAQWYLPSYTLTYNLNGGSGEGFEDIEHSRMINITLDNIPIRKGFVFVKWVNSSGDSFYPGDPYFFQYGNDTLTAVWRLEHEDSFGNGASTRIHQIGNFGKAEVDLRDGKILLEFNDFSWQGNRMPISMNHLYDGRYGDNKYIYNNNIDINTGNGMKLDIVQCMNEAHIVHPDGRESYYTYIGPNREEYFVCNGTNLYVSMDDSDTVYNSLTNTMTSGDEIYKFDSYGRLFSLTDEDENEQIFEYSSDKIKKITDGAGRNFAFAYSSDKLSSVTLPDDSTVMYGYNGNNLSSITYPDGSSVNITYNLSKKPYQILVADANDVNVCRYVFDYDISERVSTVTEYGVSETGSFVLGKVYTYTYYGNKTCVTVAPMPGDTSETVEDVYFLDENANIDNQYVKFSESSTNTALLSVTSFSDNGYAVRTVVNNYLSSHNADSLDYWEKIGDDDVVLSVVTESTNQKSMYGQEHITIEKISDDELEYGMYQDLVLPEGEYTFSAYIRLRDTASGKTVFPDTCLTISAIENGSLTVISESEHINVNENIYTRVSVSFALSEETVVRAAICATNKGVICVDGLQLENNPYLNAYNMLENGSFEDGRTSWYGDFDVCYGENNPFHMLKQAELSGNPSSETYICQDVSVKKAASTRETFTLSGWCRATDYSKLSANSACRLRAKFTYADNTTEYTESANFIPGVSEWQYAEIQFCKSLCKEVVNLTVYCEYNFENGSAYVDAVSLVRDYIEYNVSEEDFDGYEGDDSSDNGDENETSEAEFSEAVDEYGNTLTETIFSDNEDDGTIYRSFDYSDNGNDLVKETDPRGNDTLYDVDHETSRVTTVTDRCGGMTSYEYDSMGRTTKVTAGNSDVSYSYNGTGDMTEIVRGDGMKYVLEYDAYRNLDSIGIDGKSEKLIKYNYRDHNGRLKRITYANGDYMLLSYDRLGRMISEKWFNNDGDPTYEYTYAYDGEGNIVKTVDKVSEKEYNYTYDEGKLIRAVEYDVTLSNGVVTSKTRVVSIVYVYDDEGELIKKKVKYPDGTESIIEPTRETDDNIDSVHFYSDVSGTASFDASTTTDGLGRKTESLVKIFTTEYSYHDGEVTAEHTSNNKVKGAATTRLVKDIVSNVRGNLRSLSYEYDEEERITKVIDSEEGTTEYTYDALGQLLTETKNGVTTRFEYDNYGNITAKGVVDETGNIASDTRVDYVYSTGSWKDLLISYGDQSITYDAQGNPTTYRGKTLVWEKGRQLKSYDGINYTYNANGIRTSKTVDGVKHTYILDGTKILRESWGENTLVPLYDNEENVCGISYNGRAYYFIKNLQGDVVTIVDGRGTKVGNYIYDAWGKCTVELISTNANVIAAVNANPYRYRGYYYDSETGLYYLQSRYYDPEVGRFINGDEVLFGTNLAEGILDNNLFAYANNNPICNEDSFGYSAVAAYSVSSAVYSQMIAMSTTAATLMASVKAFVAMIWNIFVVVGLLLIVIASIVYLCKTASNIYSKITDGIKAKEDDYKKYKGKFYVYVLTRLANNMKSIFYVGRTKEPERRYNAHANTKGEFYMYVIYICSSLEQSRVVEQCVLASCLVGEFTDIIFGKSPSNRIRGISAKKAEKAVTKLAKETKDTIELLCCTKESDLLMLMNM